MHLEHPYSPLQHLIRHFLRYASSSLGQLIFPFLLISLYAVVHRESTFKALCLGYLTFCGYGSRATAIFHLAWNGLPFAMYLVGLTLCHRLDSTLEICNS